MAKGFASAAPTPEVAAYCNRVAARLRPARLSELRYHNYRLERIGIANWTESAALSIRDRSVARLHLGGWRQRTSPAWSL